MNRTTLIAGLVTAATLAIGTLSAQADPYHTGPGAYGPRGPMVVYHRPYGGPGYFHRPHVGPVWRPVWPAWRMHRPHRHWGNWR